MTDALQGIQCEGHRHPDNYPAIHTWAAGARFWGSLPGMLKTAHAKYTHRSQHTSSLHILSTLYTKCLDNSRVCGLRHATFKACSRLIMITTASAQTEQLCSSKACIMEHQCILYTSSEEQICLSAHLICTPKLVASSCTAQRTAPCDPDTLPCGREVSHKPVDPHAMKTYSCAVHLQSLMLAKVRGAVLVCPPCAHNNMRQVGTSASNGSCRVDNMAEDSGSCGENERRRYVFQLQLRSGVFARGVVVGTGPVGPG